MSAAQHTPGPLRVGGEYNWRHQPERLAYMGVRRYPGDRRDWHQFEKVDEPGVVWCEVLDTDLAHFEETESAAIAKATEPDPITSYYADKAQRGQPPGNPR